MAARKAGNKKTTKAKTKTTVKKNTENSFLTTEIIVWVTLAISIILLLGLFGIGGFVGAGIKKALIFCFGVTAYAFPFLLFGGVAFVMSNKDNKKAYQKIACVAILYILFCILFSLINELGGAIGNGIVHLIQPAIGTIGSFLITIILMIIVIVIVTGKSLLRPVQKHSTKAYQKAKEDLLVKREKSEERKAEQSLKRASHRAEGVSFATTLNQQDEKKEVAKKKRMPEIKPEKIVEKETPTLTIENSNEVKEEDSPRRTHKKESFKEVHEETKALDSVIKEKENQDSGDYKFPPIDLLKKGKKTTTITNEHLRETADKLEEILDNFGVKVTVTNVSCGPTVTRYELQPEMGVKVSKIVGLADDIKLNLAAADIRIEAPIPGKAAVGIEVPNKTNGTVMLRDIIDGESFKSSTSKISFAVGKDLGGRDVVSDIAKMPHVLIAGATGSGKSVCINTLIMSILYKATDKEVKFIMIDPKVVELSVYNGISNLLIPVVTDPKKAAVALNWAVAEMDRRYHLFAEFGVRDINGFNQMVEAKTEEGVGKLSQIVVVVDELADLMMVAPSEVEESICRLAQLARAAGIHLVIATQRPSVNVITGLIKANMPSRIAFSVTSGVDSRTIIDMNGAEKLLGKGDMLFYPAGSQKPARVQGAFVSDREVGAVADFLKANNTGGSYDESVEEHVNTATTISDNKGITREDNERDAYFYEAGELIIEKEKASIGMLQRAFKIGFNRAARIMDQLHEAGVVGGEEGTKPRKILMNLEEFKSTNADN
ncbi:MAG TPA: DNA translocase FtsK [Candidatus Dorea intestinavium]|nr:DNA translocase FtsK [Candidatus Dorea intestinavium]